MDRDEVLLLAQGMEKLDLFLTGMAGNVDFAQLTVDDVRAAAVQLVDDAADALLVAGNGRGGNDHRVVFAYRNFVEFSARHTRKRAHGFALRAGGNDYDFAVFKIPAFFYVHDKFVGYGKFAYLVGGVRDIYHTSARKCDLPLVFDGKI